MSLLILCPECMIHVITHTEYMIYILLLNVTLNVTCNIFLVHLFYMRGESKTLLQSPDARICKIKL